MMWEILAYGSLLGVGLVCLWSLYSSRRPTLAQRVKNAGGRSASLRGNAWLISAAGLWMRTIEALGSTTVSVERRLELLGEGRSVTAFRVEQLLAAVVSVVTLGTGTIVLLRSWSVGSVLLSLISLALGAFLGVAVWDQLLTMRAKQRQARIDQQVPDTSDLLALALGAGESIPASLERMSRIAHGELSVELGRTVAQLNSGAPTTGALLELSRRNDSRALDRLCQTLVTALERGSPLAVVLHDQAKDIRESTRQRLMEEGGRREIAMLIPVVFLILPVTVLFALYPGLSALQIGS